MSLDAEKDINEIMNTISTVNIDDIKSDGIVIKSGNRILKMEVVEENEIDIEEIIKKDLKEQFYKKLEIIREKINQKIFEMSDFVSRIKDEYNTKEKKLNKKLSEQYVMPNIKRSDAEKGISVVKGDGGTLIWLIASNFQIKTIDFKPINIRWQNKTKKIIYVEVTTVGNQITKVCTRNLFGLEYFQHYHQINPDCWGDWTHNIKWKTPDDIIKIAREATIILENINSKSMGIRNPLNLPKFETLKKHLLTKKEIEMLQEGRTSTVQSPVHDNNDVWEV